jgi:hypothetical protein
MNKGKSKQCKQLPASIKSQRGKATTLILEIILTYAPAIITAAMPAILQFMNR